jgi:hypothetical protein
VVSDDAGNTRAARNLLAQQYPWLITLVDACHQQNNTAKDIGNLPYFRLCSSQLRSIVTFFHSSTCAKRHLAALSVLRHVHGAIISIGKTRFATYYYSAQSTLRCLPLILELISSGVISSKTEFAGEHLRAYRGSPDAPRASGAKVTCRERPKS